MLKASIGDIYRSIMVSITALSAFHTLKNCLAATIRFCDMATGRALAASVSRINGDRRDTGTLGLVFDFYSQICKTPVVQFASFGMSGLNPISNSRQVFNGNRKGQAFRLGNNCFGNGMVGNLLKPRLFTAQGMESAFGSAASCFLEHGTLGGIPSADSFNMFPTKRFTHAIGGYIDYSKIKPQNAFRSDWLSLINIDNTRCIPFALDEHQINFALAEWDQVTLMFAAYERDSLSAVECPDVDVVTLSEAEDTIIERLRTPLAELALLLTPVLEFVGIRNLGDAAHGSLRGKPELFTYGVVMRLMQFILPEYSRLKSELGKPVTRLIATLKRILQRSLLCCIRDKFEVDYKFHVVKYRLCWHTVNIFLGGENRLLPSPP